MSAMRKVRACVRACVCVRSRARELANRVTGVRNARTHRYVHAKINEYMCERKGERERWGGRGGRTKERFAIVARATSLLLLSYLDETLTRFGFLISSRITQALRFSFFSLPLPSLLVTYDPSAMLCLSDICICF